MIHADRRAKAGAFRGDAAVLAASLEVQVSKLREELGRVEGQESIERLPMTRQQRRAAASRVRKQTKKLRREAATLGAVKKAAEAIKGARAEVRTVDGAPPPERWTLAHGFAGGEWVAYEGDRLCHGGWNVAAVVAAIYRRAGGMVPVFFVHVPTDEDPHDSLREALAGVPAPKHHGNEPEPGEPEES